MRILPVPIFHKFVGQLHLAALAEPDVFFVFLQDEVVAVRLFARPVRSHIIRVDGFGGFFLRAQAVFFDVLGLVFFRQRVQGYPERLAAVSAATSRFYIAQLAILAGHGVPLDCAFADFQQRRRFCYREQHVSHDVPPLSGAGERKVLAGKAGS